MMENQEPLVSVIMAVHNGAVWIDDAIRSVIGQSYPYVELLVINDGSNDNTEEVVLQFANFADNIRYFKQQHRGVSAARNVGLKQMSGSFFMFLDADDCLTRKSIELRMQMFQKDESLTFCDGPVTVFDDSLLVPIRHWNPAASGLVFKRLIALSASCFFGPTWLIRRDFSIAYSFQEDMTHAEDLFFFMEIAGRGRYDSVHQDILKYRTSPQSAMRNLNALATGYKSLYKKVLNSFNSEITVLDRIYLWIKIRKIVTLSFISRGNFRDAFFFFLSGAVK